MVISNLQVLLTLCGLFSLTAVANVQFTDELEKVVDSNSPKIKFSKVKKADKEKLEQELQDATSTVNAHSVSVTELGEISEKFVVALQNKKPEEFYKNLDVDKIVNQALTGSIQKLDNLREERDNVIRGIVAIPDILITKIGKRGHIKYLRIVKRGTKYRGLVRIKFNNGEITYLELIAEKDTENNLKIVDYYDLMLGRKYTTIVSQMLIKVDNSNQPDKIFIYKNKAVSFQDRYAQMIRYYQSSKFDEALNSFQHLPSKFKETKDILLLRVQISKATNRNAYRESLVLLEKNHSNDPEFGLLLSDHYFFTKQYPLALKSLGQFSAYIGGDIALDSLRVKIFNSQNKFKQAITIGVEAIKEDDSYEDIYWFLLKSYLHSYQYQHVGQTLDVLVDKFHAKFDIEHFYKDPFYREYGYSKYFKKWKEKHTIADKPEQKKIVKTETNDSFDDDEEE